MTTPYTIVKIGLSGFRPGPTSIQIQIQIQIQQLFLLRPLQSDRWRITEVS